MRAVRGLIALTLLVSSCVYGGGPSGVTALLAGGLRPFDDCEELLSYLRGHALERVTSWGLPGGWWGGPEVFLEEAVAAEAPGNARASVPGRDYSTTNVQTAGVDEPDIVKTDGRRLLALARGRLFVVDLAGGTPELRGSVRIRDLWARDLLLFGDRALLLGEAGGGEVPRPLLRGFWEGGRSITALVEVDLSDPGEPRLGRRLLLDGRYLSARMTDGVVRVVVRSFPSGLRFEPPGGGGLRAEREALRRNREVIRSSTIEDWVPRFVLEDAEGETLGEGALLDCAAAHHPPEFSGFGMLTVVTLDLSRGLPEDAGRSSVGVVSDGETVYASAGSLYVATQRWVDWEAFEGGEGPEEGQVTRIHRFDISGHDRAAYRSSGVVPGWLLNQFSMDEHRGRLRVASTDSPPFLDAPGASESMVTVLVERGPRLVQVGRVAGLGRGERIFAVRFVGDRGYVVTFREVDPLYVLDLSDPTRPSVEGELKILGYSAYLHPLGEHLLLGVGQDATEGGRLKGTQVSLFDVSDPTDPRRVDAIQISDASSEVEWDHHAFLYWEPEGLAVIPVNVYAWGPGETAEAFFGAVAVRVRGGELREAGRLEHETAGAADWGVGIRRSIVVGDLLYTVSEVGVEAADLTTLETVGWLPFAL